MATYILQYSCAVHPSTVARTDLSTEAAAAGGEPVQLGGRHLGQADAAGRSPLGRQLERLPAAAAAAAGRLARLLQTAQRDGVPQRRPHHRHRGRERGARRRQRAQQTTRHAARATLLRRRAGPVTMGYRTSQAGSGTGQSDTSWSEEPVEERRRQNWESYRYSDAVCYHVECLLMH